MLKEQPGPYNLSNKEPGLRLARTPFFASYLIKGEENLDTDQVLTLSADGEDLGSVLPWNGERNWELLSGGGELSSNVGLVDILLDLGDLEASEEDLASDGWDEEVLLRHLLDLNGEVLSGFWDLWDELVGDDFEPLGVFGFEAFAWLKAVESGQGATGEKGHDQELEGGGVA